ncbi:DHHW family protein [Acetobacterium wieringae]|uniref:DHHW family protein n=1 Tax=Acetobacterium wieringae TaxID=52694 RepID=UPI0026EE23D9|nr:DHHW family protein [Acetobacterium wieringae]
MRKQDNHRDHDQYSHSLFYKKYINLLGLLFIGSLVFFPLASLILPDTKLSANENRILTQFPRFSADSVMDGRYMKKMQKYTADQLIGRNFWIYTKTSTDRIIGKNISNGVFYGKNSTLIENFDPLPSDTTDQTKTALNTFVEKHPDLNHFFMLVPNAISVTDDKLPAYAPVLDQNTYIDSFTASLSQQLTILDPRPILNQNLDQQLYYKTDHHWTTLGAWLSFQGVANAMGITPEPDAYAVYPVSHSFSGALASKSGYLTFVTDTIEVYIPKNEDTYSIVNFIEEQKKSTSLFDSEKLNKKDKYAVFLSGNHPLIKIKNPVANSKNLLVIKDSYANAFIPFLTPFYSEITVIDPRYYYDSIDELIADAQITDVLYLFNANTFFRDTTLEPFLNDD